MFNPITIPFGAVMLFNVVKLKPGISTDDVEMAIGEMCNVVKNTYGNETGGFIGGQVFNYNGFISEERQRSGRDQLKRILSGEMVPFPVRQVYVETQISFLPGFQEYVNEILREIDGESPK